MFCFVNVLCVFGVVIYGSVMFLSIWYDLVVFYSKFIMKLGVYVEDGVNMLIECFWMEKFF